MKKRNKDAITKVIADDIINRLKSQGFAIQRYDSYSSNSIYLKIDYGVCHSIRISDHEGKDYLHYRYNVIIGGNKEVTLDNQDGLPRYYFDENQLDNLISLIIFNRMINIYKKGKRGYIGLMEQNKQKYKNDAGFWKSAKVIYDPYKKERNKA